MLLVVIADKVHLKENYRAEFKLTLSEPVVDRSKKTPSLKSASLSARWFALYAYIFEVAWRSNLDDHSRNRAHACKTRGLHCHPLQNVGKYQNWTSYTRVSARHNWDARAPLWVSFSKGFWAAKSKRLFYLLLKLRTIFCNFRWRPSPYPFPNPIFTLLKIPYLNRNHRR